MARRAPPPRHGRHLGRHPEEIRRGSRAAPDLRRAVEIRHRGCADRPRFPRPAQRTGAARRQVAERKVLHAPPAGTYACRRPRAADRGHEPRRIRGRRGRGVPPLEILDRRGRLPRRARRVPLARSRHRRPQGEDRCRSRVHRHAALLRQRAVLRLRAPVP